MKVFSQIEGEIAVVRSGGVFKQVDLYRRGNDLFASHGSGFIRLLDKGATSHPKVMWDEISLASPSQYTVGPHGRIALKG